MKIEISNGDFVDRITILKIKLAKIKIPDKLENVRNEYRCLLPHLDTLGIGESSPQFRRLQAINQKLWDIEDNIRAKEAQHHFDAEFINLARQVYILNDQRAKIKREINITTGSRFIEEKEYINY